MSDHQVRVAEEWRPVPGYELLYSVSNRGHIRRDAPDTAGRAGYLLKPSVDRRGYHRIILTLNGGQATLAIHRLVLLAFIGKPPENKPETRHLDGNPSNNVLDNLCWGDRLEQAEDMRRHGTTAVGDRHGTRTKPESVPRGSSRAFAKLTETQVIEIRKSLSEGQTLKSIASRYKVDSQTIANIRDGKLWRHVGSEGEATPRN